MNTKQMIAIPKDKAMDLITGVFNMSMPAGLGFLHFTPGDGLPEESKKFYEEQLQREPRYEGDALIHMDYVEGRQCKMAIFASPDKEDDNLYIRNDWYDHSDFQLAELLESIGFEDGMRAIQEARVEDK